MLLPARCDPSALSGGPPAHLGGSSSTQQGCKHNQEQAALVERHSVLARGSEVFDRPGFVRNDLEDPRPLISLAMNVNVLVLTLLLAVEVFAKKLRPSAMCQCDVSGPRIGGQALDFPRLLHATC